MNSPGGKSSTVTCGRFRHPERRQTISISERQDAHRRATGLAGLRLVPSLPLAPDLIDGPLERVNNEIKSRTDVVGVVYAATLRRLAGSVLIGQPPITATSPKPRCSSWTP